MNHAASAHFGTAFPVGAAKGDVFIRVDVLPHKLFKYDGDKWFEINKERTSVYLDNDGYIDLLRNDVNSGKIDKDDLTDDERAELYD